MIKKSDVVGIEIQRGGRRHDERRYVLRCLPGCFLRMTDILYLSTYLGSYAEGILNVNFDAFCEKESRFECLR